SANGGIGDSQLGLDLLDDAAVLHERFEKAELVPREAREAVEGELALDAGAAGIAVQMRNCQLVAADRALVGDGVSLGIGGCLAHRWCSLMCRVVGCRVESVLWRRCAALADHAPMLAGRLEKVN